MAKVFPWVPTAISNAKTKLLGLHHHVKGNYMQNYLSEFYYKFNRRCFGVALFDRLVVTALKNHGINLIPYNVESLLFSY